MAKKQNKENETETVKSTEMDSFLSVIQAAFGKKSDIFVKDPSNIDLERFSTGSYLLDRDLKGGWVKGTMIEIYGNESSGKTTLAIHSAAEHQKAYPNEKVLWIDLEKVFDPVYFKTIGLNIEPENFLLARPNTGEEAWQIMIEFTKAFQNGLIVLDSVALLLPEKEEEMLMTENSFAQAARMNSLGLRKLFPHVKMGGTTIIALNQVREDIGAYGDSDKSTGGNGWKFYARTRLKTSKSKGEAGEYAVHKYRQIKSNYGTPDAITETTINYGEGFNKVREFIKVCLAEGLIQRAGSWFSYGDVKLGQGENAVVEILQDNPELFDELFKKLKDLKVL